MSSEEQSKERETLIIKMITDELSPVDIEIEDKSHLHKNHEEAKRHGGGHFNLKVVSDKFEGKTELERHRMIYAALGDVVGQQVHALSIKALSPSEVSTAE